MLTLVKQDYIPLIEAALAEDIGTGDITSRLTVPESHTSEFHLCAREALVVAGLAVAQAVFSAVDSGLEFVTTTKDGDICAAGESMAVIRGLTRSIFKAERTALNILQRMCGIATKTKYYVDDIEGTRAVILDTRKTVPGLRMLDKYAVACGGGQNHRIRLDDAILIKDNHIAAAGSLRTALENALRGAPEGMLVEVECDTLEQVSEALEVGAQRIMLDNMSPEMLRQSVRMVAGRVPLEASGGITIENIRAVAETGVDYISVGCLTHSPRAADIGLDALP